MPDLDDVNLTQIELRTRRKTAHVLHGLFALAVMPHRDAIGTLRHGFGRPIEKRPISERAADLVLTEEIMQAQEILRGRVFEILAVHPEVEARLPYLYAVADILGPERMRDWAELWTAVRRGDWEGVATELFACNWNQLLESSMANTRAVVTIINRLQLGIPVNSLQ